MDPRQENDEKRYCAEVAGSVRRAVAGLPLITEKGIEEIIARALVEERAKVRTEERARARALWLKCVDTYLDTQRGICMRYLEKEGPL